MSGHSKWHSIKHKKMATDAKRGKMFTKFLREIMMAAKTGGGSPDTNPPLRMAIERAKGFNMPNDNIQRAIKKGLGEDGGMVLEQVTYEGYGPGGVALFVEVLTDNKNRSASEVRSIFSKNNGSLGGVGSVAWIFERKGIINVAKDKADEDELMEIVLESGAEDMSLEEDVYEIVVMPENFESVKSALAEKKVEVSDANITFIPKNTVKVEGKQAEQVLKLHETLEDHNDVQGAYANFDISDEIIEAMQSG